MSSIQPWLTKAGAYPVTRIPCDTHFATSMVDLAKPRAGVLHTTECNWAGAMGVFHKHYAPHFIVGVNAAHLSHMRAVAMGAAPSKTPPEPSGAAEIVQMVPIGAIGAALVTDNAWAIAQIEMVGYAREELWLPEAGTLDALASLMLVLRDQLGIPLSHPWKDGDYGRYGANAHRSSGKFGTVPGWFGHCDIPKNDHWDPGNMSWSKVFAHATALDAAAKTPAKPATPPLVS